MSKQRSSYEIKPFPLSRRLVVDAMRLGRRKPAIRGLIEVDVTEARRRLHLHREETGESLSFTAFILVCLGHAVEANKYMHAYKDWFGRLVLYDDVDANTIIEIDLQGQKFPLAHVIRAINRRTVRDITDEIRAVQSDPALSIGSKTRRRAMMAFLMLPGVIRRAVYRVINSNPHWAKKYIGTVAVTAVGMYTEGGGWGIGSSLYNLGLTLGGIANKPGVIDGRIEIREYLCVTLDFNHDVIDGAPAARFAARWKELVESGYGLEELDAASSIPAQDTDRDNGR
jgi:pyruvate/2-oxoglutarate dehydrogenase complex dihydrolipoamide acyltransferase (E2) component